ncbi:MAG: T9SS type A sorting domain-containing protein [bacterium]|nr:T9SS type A sorting domain-containing protein [bacterium]
MKGLFVGISICIALSDSFADAPSTLWEKTFGGASTDMGYSVKQTIDGGYVMTGSTNSYGAGGSDVWLIKTDAFGDTLWTKTFGGTGNDGGYVVQQTFDRGYIITGNTNFCDTANFWLVKTDSLGDTLWTRSWGMQGYWDYGFSGQQTSDSGYIVTGCWHGASDYDLYLVKTDASGDTLWTRTFGDTAQNWGESVQQTFDNGYIIAGRTTINNEGVIWLLKTDASGDTLWTKTLNKTPWSKGRAVQQTFDSGYIVIGYTIADTEDICLIKTDSNGDTLWTRIFGGDSSDISYSVQQTSDSGYVLVGYTKSYGAGNYDGWLIKTDASGDTLWTKTFGGSAQDRGYSVQETEDRGYIVTGWTASSGAGSYDLWLIRISGSGIEESSISVPPGRDVATLQFRGNPFVKSTVISYKIPIMSKVSLAIYDISGSCVKTLLDEEKAAGSYSINLNAKELKAGIYFVQMNTGTFKTTKKITVIK